MHVKQNASSDEVILNCVAGVLPEEARKALGSRSLCGGQNVSLHLSKEHNVPF